MNKLKQSARLKFIVLLTLMAFVVAGCANVRRGVAWPDLELVTINDDVRVVVTYNDRIVAIDPYQGGQVHVARDADGEILRDDSGEIQQWNVELRLGNNETFYVSPFREGDNFIFPTYDNRLIEVDVISGQILSEDGIPVRDGVIADVAIDDNFVYVPYRLGGVQALNRETYAVEWTFETEEGGVWSSPLLEDGTLYVGTIGHGLYALDAASGQELWDEPVDLEGAIASAPVLYDGFLYVGSYSHKLYKISLTGEIVAEYEGNNWIWGTPVIGQSVSPVITLQDDSDATTENAGADVLYYTDLDGYVYALDTNDLTVIWAERPANRGIRPAPIVTENFVIVASRNGSVYWLDRETGQTVQEVEVDSGPELLSDILYLAADEENGRPELLLVASTDTKRLVNAFNMDTFSLQWVYEQ